MLATNNDSESVFNELIQPITNLDPLLTAFIDEATPHVQAARSNFIQQTTQFTWTNDHEVTFRVRGYHGSNYDSLQELGYDWPLMYFHRIKFIVLGAAWVEETGDLVSIWGLHASEEKQSVFAIIGHSEDARGIGDVAEEDDVPYSDSFIVSRQDYEVAELYCPPLLQIRVPGQSMGGTEPRVSKRDLVIAKLINAIEVEDPTNRVVPEPGYQSESVQNLSKLGSLLDSGAGNRPVREVSDSPILIPKLVVQLRDYATLSETKVEWPSGFSPEKTKLRCAIGDDDSRAKLTVCILGNLIADDPKPRKHSRSEYEDESEDSQDESEGDTAIVVGAPSQSLILSQRNIARMFDPESYWFVVPTLLRLLVVERHDSRELRRHIVTFLHNVLSHGVAYRNLLLEAHILPILIEMYNVFEPAGSERGVGSKGHDGVPSLILHLISMKPCPPFASLVPLLPVLFRICHGGSITITSDSCACLAAATEIASTLADEGITRRDAMQAVLDCGVLVEFSAFVQKFPLQIVKILGLLLSPSEELGPDSKFFLEQLRDIDIIRHLVRCKSDVMNPSPWGPNSRMTRKQRTEYINAIGGVISAFPDGYGVNLAAESAEAEALAKRSQTFGFKNLSAVQSGNMLQFGASHSSTTGERTSAIPKFSRFSEAVDPEDPPFTPPAPAPAFDAATMQSAKVSSFGGASSATRLNPIGSAAAAPFSFHGTICAASTAPFTFPVTTSGATDVVTTDAAPIFKAKRNDFVNTTNMTDGIEEDSEGLLEYQMPPSSQNFSM